MTKKQILGFLAVWIMILPFLGFSGSWKTFFFFTTGLLILFIVLFEWLKKIFYHPKGDLDKSYSSEANNTFSENTPSDSVINKRNNFVDSITEVKDNLDN